MTTATERGEVLRPVPGDAVSTTRMGAFLAGSPADDVRSLHRWSVKEPDAFWREVISFFELRIDGLDDVLLDGPLPGARWLPGARLSYPAHALRAEWNGPAVVGLSRTRKRVELSFDDLREQVARCRAGLIRLGVGEGDRVAGYLPHVPEAIVAFLAAASLGAVWVSCPPEFGARAVLDRFGQMTPTVLIAVDGVRYGERTVDRRGQVDDIRRALPSLRATILLPYLDESSVVRGEDMITWGDLLAEPGPLWFAAVGFGHPLYVLFSSGTTGLPKAIVHGHGGIVLEHHKALGLHNDVGAGDRFFWFSTTGWMMWNYAVSALLHGACVVCFDGNPGWPDLDVTWAMGERERLTHFGTSATFLMSCRSAGLRPGREHDLSSLRALGSTGSPLPAEGFRWVYDAFDSRVLLNPSSGGTDVCTAFVGASPLLPVRAGEIPGPLLGVDVHAFDQSGTPVLGEPGELVVTAAMPSMPVGLWGDDGTRMRATWFEKYPDAWTQGDWITVFADGGCVITGRSDATLNRGGVRMGTSDFYSVVEDIAGISDSLVVHLEDDTGGAGTLVLFVVGGPDHRQLENEIGSRLRIEMSPRHVPDHVVWLEALPRTLAGKKLETPVKRILHGARPDQVASRDSLVHPEALDPIASWGADGSHEARAD